MKGDDILKRQQKSGSRGGKETLKRHGTAHFSKAAKARWDIHRSKKEPLH